MSNNYDSVELALDELRDAGRWSLPFVERALGVFEERAPGDARPLASVDGAREFISGGPRTQQLRTVSLDAYRAAVETADPAASAAAHAACLLASIAYTHPIAAIHQTKHIVGPVAYAALALELVSAGDSAEALVASAIADAPAIVRALISRYPELDPGRQRVDNLMYQLDQGLRSA